MKTLLTYVISTIIFTLLLILCIKEPPVVYWSTSRDECVKIIIKGEDHSCGGYNDLDRYRKVWVK